jgi:hypothetical protein
MSEQQVLEQGATTVAEGAPEEDFSSLLKQAFRPRDQEQATQIRDRTRASFRATRSGRSRR